MTFVEAESHCGCGCLGLSWNKIGLCRAAFLTPDTRGRTIIARVLTVLVDTFEASDGRCRCKASGSKRTCSICR
eukprot:5506551-Amphidinium_carterae.1